METTLAPAVDLTDLGDLTPYARNARKHSKAQIKQIVASIEEFGWTNPILEDRGEIVAGHGRLEAATAIYAKGGRIKLPNGATLPAGSVPTIDVSGWSEEKRRAYIIADNRIAENATWDDELLKAELVFLRDEGEFRLDLTGFDGDLLLKALGEITTSGAKPDAYSKKITAPIYEPSGDAPDAVELYDDSKALALIEEIRAADLPDEVTIFLEKAAERHTVFNFRRIADFYASADAETQLLMERSALVIIDFDQAIEGGFVKLTKRLGSLATGSEPADDA